MSDALSQAGDRALSRNRVSQYLNELALNPRKLASCRRDPAASLAESGLSADEQALLRTADPARIYDFLTDHTGERRAAPVVVVVIGINAQCR